MTDTATYSVTQVARRRDGGTFEVLLTFPGGDSEHADMSADRIKLSSTALGLIRAKLAQWRGEELYTRTLTGHDHVIELGLLGGAPLRLKDPRPSVVTDEGEWEPLES